ncbi:MAG: hypothetical protein HYW63_03435 [Candidatus Levybacteria bacterium]|nr:hypothetical protein [Candidatus Levybacteria bacterium]
MNILNIKVLRNIIEVLPFVAVFFASLYRPTDPDLGWHLKYGEYFVRTGGVLRDNIFATMMPDYKWVNHSWASDVLVFLAYNLWGFLGVTLLGAAIVTLTFIFVSKAFNLSFWDKAFIFPIVLFIVSNVNAISFRSQQMSYLFTALLFYIISLYNKNPKYLFLTIPLFLIWANFHGGFILGLTLLGGYVFLKKIVEIYKKFEIRKAILAFKFESIVITGVVIATLINPFGYGVYLETFRHFGNPWLKYIAEWAPFVDMSRQWWNLIIFVNLFLASVLILFFTGRLGKEKLPVVGLIILFILLSFYERRYAWSMYYISFPILVGISGFFKPNSKSKQFFIAGGVSIIFLLIVISTKEPIKNYQTMNWQTYCQTQSNLCSYNAVLFLSKNNLTTNLSTPYSWGGWMIWNFPDVMPSVDGRMVAWKDEEGYSAFAEYYTNVTDWESIDKSKYDVVLVLKQKPMFKRLKSLTAEGKWRWLYEDPISAVFVRKNPKEITLPKKLIIPEN